MPVHQISIIPKRHTSIKLSKRLSKLVTQPITNTTRRILPFHLYIFVSICLSINLSIFLSIYLSIYRSVLSEPDRGKYKFICTVSTVSPILAGDHILTPSFNLPQQEMLEDNMAARHIHTTSIFSMFSQ